MTVTETFPSYFIGKDPDRRVIEVSYGDSLAQRFGKLNRAKIIEYGNHVFNIEVSKEKSSMTDWDIDGYRGGMISVGIGGGITGQGADLLLIDDPIKNREEADSEVYREKIWQEWQSTLYTRLHPGGAVIIILTRWHEDDLAGRLLNPEYGEVEDWTIISLPAKAEEGDLLGRAPGEPLWPEHGYDQAWMDTTKKAVGSYAWAALYQQRPSPAKGTMFKREWWKYYKEPPNDFRVIIQSWDMTFKDTQGTDYVVGQVWGLHKADKYLLDQVRDRMDFVTTCEAVRNLSAKWPQTNYKLVEDKANGPAVISTLQRELGGFIAVKPDGSKEARASAVAPSIEAGNVYIPDPSIAPWVNDYVEECSAFPKGANDDQVDAMSQALNRLNTYIYSEPESSKLDELAERFGKGSAEYEIYSQIVSLQEGDKKIDVSEII
jgi:predicted phage terminase large subunit-like protein